MFIENWMKNEIYRLSKDDSAAIGIMNETDLNELEFIEDKIR